jgi:peptidoglycan/LPS O-acetylase OafA/YrhL
VLTFTGLQAIKLWATISSWNYLNSLPLSVSPVYLGVNAAVWMIIGGVLAFGLWRVRSWALPATRWAIIVYFLEVWLDRVVLQPKGPQQSTWLFDLLLSLVIIASSIGNIALPKVRAYFGEGNE